MFRNVYLSLIHTTSKDRDYVHFQEGNDAEKSNFKAVPITDTHSQSLLSLQTDTFTGVNTDTIQNSTDLLQLFSGLKESSV